MLIAITIQEKHNMKLLLLELGVGLVSGACFAEMGGCDLC